MEISLSIEAALESNEVCETSTFAPTFRIASLKREELGKAWIYSTQTIISYEHGVCVTPFTVGKLLRWLNHFTNSCQKICYDYVLFLQTVNWFKPRL